MKNLLNWLSLEDYETDKRDASIRIVKKQSRGNISAQNGWKLSRKKLIALSHKADHHLKHLREMLERPI